jgi:hypothetical protein
MKIGNKIVLTLPQHKNEYKVTIVNMSGDGDNYEPVVIYMSKDKETEIEKIKKFCDRCVGTDWPRRDVIETEAINQFGSVPEWLTRDIFSDGEDVCRPDFKEVTYFDENGDEFTVII